MATGNAFTLRSIKKSATEFMNAFDGYNASFGKYFSKVTIGELIASLDAFYQEPRNGNIQVVDAIRVVTNEKAGASRAELDSMIVEYRKPNRP